MKNIEKRVVAEVEGGVEGRKVFPSVNVSYLTNDVAGCWMPMLDVPVGCFAC